MCHYLMDCKASEGIDAKEIDTQRRDLQDISMNIDDPIWVIAQQIKTIQYQITCTCRVIMIGQARTTKTRLSIKESGKT